MTTTVNGIKVPDRCQKLVERMNRLGFRLRMHYWNPEDKKVIVVGFDVPKFDDAGDLPPMQPPCGFWCCTNENIEGCLRTVVRKSRRFARTPYPWMALKVAWWKCLYFFLPKYSGIRDAVWQKMYLAELHLADLERLKFWRSSRCQICLAPI